MTTPCQPPGPIDEELGTDGGHRYVRCGANVYYQSGVYYRTAGVYSCWPRTAVARRIAGAAERRERDERKVREAMRREAAVRTEGGRRVG